MPIAILCGHFGKLFVSSLPGESELSAQHRLIGKLLRAARRRRDVTQQDLAGRLGRSTTFVSRFESGARTLDVVHFLEVTRALGIPPHRLLRRIERELFGDSLDKKQEPTH